MHPNRGTLLLTIGIGASLLGFALSAFGAFSLIHTSRNVALHQGLDDYALLAEYEGYRNLALLILAGGLVVLIAGGVCVLAYCTGRSKLAQYTLEDRAG